MPARTALAPRRLPVRLALLLRFPEDKIERILLLVLAGDEQRSRAAPQIVDVLVGQLPVFPELAGAVVHRAVLCNIGVPLVDQGLDHIDHALNLLRRLRMNRRRTDVQGLHILLALFDIALGNDVRRHPFFHGLLDDFVVHIGEIRDEQHAVSLIFKISAHAVKHEHRARVADMDQVVDGRAADIHADLSRMEGMKFLQLL